MSLMFSYSYTNAGYLVNYTVKSFYFKYIALCYVNKNIYFMYFYSYGLT